jgi:D-cysteine desulfhydrase family pyridoxal phosphate-dependent enzyme
MRLDDFPTISLAHLPTPLEPAPRLGAAMGLPNLWVKRDDCTGLAMGGNKARKLEYLMAEAAAQGADVVLTTGGVQSNHARMTAAAACKLRMRAVLLLQDLEPATDLGNLVLDRLFGAEIRFAAEMSIHEVHGELARIANQLREQGHKPYIIPVGGSTPLGCLGYVRAVRELAHQSAEIGLRVDAMTVAAGSTGTLAGVLLGTRAFMPDTRVYGVSVSPLAGPGRQKCARIIGEAAEMLGFDWRPDAAEIPIYDEWLGEAYGVPTPEGMGAIHTAARTEGYLLDPVYTGKALAGTKGLAHRGELKPDETVVFWHTGGAPALFAFTSLFAPSID